MEAVACKSFNTRSWLKNRQLAWLLATKIMSNLPTNSKKKSSCRKLRPESKLKADLGALGAGLYIIWVSPSIWVSFPFAVFRKPAILEEEDCSRKEEDRRARRKRIHTVAQIRAQRAKELARAGNATNFLRAHSAIAILAAALRRRKMISNIHVPKFE